MATASRSRPASPATPPAPEPPRFPTVAALLDRLGDIPPDRIRLHPTPGTATEADLIAANDRDDAICELIDGVLVEKPMGHQESVLATLLAHFLLDFVRRHGLGVVAGADGPFRTAPGQVRLPDVAFFAAARYSRRKDRRSPIAGLAPDLAVEVLSPSNTRREIAQKLVEYFAAGTRIVWIVDPKRRTVRVHTGPARPKVLREADTLDGGDVLPGFTLLLRELFAELDR